MSKLTKEETREHETAMDLIESNRELSHEERVFAFDNYRPDAAHNVAVGGAFFTPFDAAFELAVFGHGWERDSYIDLCAGIGVLAYAILCHEGSRVGRLVCLEREPEFVRVGKRLLPEADWVCADAFDPDTYRELPIPFSLGISNPPYGRLPRTGGTRGWLHNGPSHLLIAEIMLRICWEGGTLIIPEGDAEYNLRWRKEQTSTHLRRFKKAFPGVRLYPNAVDLSQYSGMWRGGSDFVAIADLDPSEMATRTPLGV